MERLGLVVLGAIIGGILLEVLRPPAGARPRQVQVQIGGQRNRPPQAAILVPLPREVPPTATAQALPELEPGPDPRPVAVMMPMVSIMAFSSGQRWCDLNVLMNACYQDYPHSRLELLFAETAKTPSELFLRINSSKTGVQFCNITIKYFFYPHQDGTERAKSLGGKRNTMSELATGDVLVSMDNDDFYHPWYVASVVKKMDFGGPNELDLVWVGQHGWASMNPDGSYLLNEHEHGPKPRATYGAHMTSYTRKYFARCRWSEINAMEEHRFIDCGARGMKMQQIDRSGPGAVGYGNPLLMIKFQNPLSIVYFTWNIDMHEIVARLTQPDWQNLIKWFDYHLRGLHELTRPKHIPRIELRDVGVNDRWDGKSPDKVDPVSDISYAARMLDQPRAPGWWQDFQRDHSKPPFFDEGMITKASGCKEAGFERRPGQEYTKGGRNVGVTNNVEECCSKCRAEKAGASVNPCTAFQYSLVDKQCTIFETEELNGQKRLPSGRVSDPAGVLILHTAVMQGAA